MAPRDRCRVAQRLLESVFFRSDLGEAAIAPGSINLELVSCLYQNRSSSRTCFDHLPSINLKILLETLPLL